jgi:hypothetical protein
MASEAKMLHLSQVVPGVTGELRKFQEMLRAADSGNVALPIFWSANSCTLLVWKREGLICFRLAPVEFPETKPRSIRC